MCGCWGGMHGCWGACVVAGRDAWLLTGGMHGCQGGMRGEGGHVWQRGACMAKVAVHREGGCVAKGGCAWQQGGAWQRGVCVAKGGHAWDMTRYRDTINERAVRILLECILVEVVVRKKP